MGNTDFRAGSGERNSGISWVVQSDSAGVNHFDQ